MNTTEKRRSARVYSVYLSDRKDMASEEISAAGKALLKFALADSYSLPDRELKIGKGAHGKPYLTDYPDIYFNISHSGDYVVCAVSDYEIGIDVQEQRVTDIQKLEKLGKKVFSVEEYRAFLADEEKQDAFFREWVMKEAYVKWTGEGLLRDMRELPMDGWHEFIEIDQGYFCALWAALPLQVEVCSVEDQRLGT